MKLSLKQTQVSQQLKTCIILGIYEDGGLTATAEEVDKLTGGYLKKLLSQGSFQAKSAQTLSLFHLAQGFEQILLVGCGKEKSLTPTGFKKIVQAAMKALTASPMTQATCYLTDLTVKDKGLPTLVKQIAEIAHDSLYRFDRYKSEKEPVSKIEEMLIQLPDPAAVTACETALAQGVATAEGVTLTKNLGNLPSNICTPSFIAEQAQELGEQYENITVNVLDEATMQELGMGALLAVAQGSEEEAKLVCLEYFGTDKSKAPIALVGKGVTFDTGGNSIKPADSMVGMKYDMCGAATVLGTMKAIAELNLPVNVVGLIPAVENMPGGTAYNPEDILTSMSGQTIEVISTDAEGRLILADALTYCERYQPKAVIDIATLTGAVVIALGTQATGLLSNHDGLAQDLLKAGLESHDRAWQLPMWDEYQEQIKSPFADMANVGGRSAGTITAGCFLSRFAKKFHWAHLDVAGTAAVMFGTNERMATGRPVPMLVQYLIDQANE